MLPHWSVLIIDGRVMAPPLPLRQTGLNVGSVIPSPKFSTKRVCVNSVPTLMLWIPEA